MLQPQSKRKIDPYSVRASPLEMRFGDILLSRGTCFFWEAAGNRYLVTNWHNLSGINPLTGKHLSPTAAEPDRVMFDLWANQSFDVRGQAIVLLDDNTGSLWLEHPMFGRKVDVACVKLPPDLAPHVVPINTFQEVALTTCIADDVFILGYPLGIGVDRLPIWKRASVASEPDIWVDCLPKMLVDTASASGMSGSPVIRHAYSGETEDGSYVTFALPANRFIGVYSGRLTTGHNLDAQLGIVWRGEVVRQIIAADVRAKKH